MSKSTNYHLLLPIANQLLENDAQKLSLLTSAGFLVRTACFGQLKLKLCLVGLGKKRRVNMEKHTMFMGIPDSKILGTLLEFMAT